MKLKCKPTLNIGPEQDTLSIAFEKGQTSPLFDLITNIEQLNLDKEYTVKIEEKKAKRSLDANAYMWVLINKLGEKLRQTDLEVYRRFIHECGVFEIVPIKEEAIDVWTRNWSKRGLGWVVEDLGSCRSFTGYHNLKCYYGSSTYNTKEMSRILDSICVECQEQGIETKTPEELNRLKQQWNVE